MSSDPFEQFSKIFTTELGKAAMNAWQETWTKCLTASFDQSRGVPQSPITMWQDMLKKSMPQGFGQAPWQAFADAYSSQAKHGSANPAFDFFQHFQQQFFNPGSADLGGAAAYLQFGQFIQQYLDLFSAGADPGQLAQQMSSAVQNSVGEISSFDSIPWMNMFAQATSSANLLQSISETFGNNPFSETLASAVGSFTKTNPSAAVGPAREWQNAMTDIAIAYDRFRNAQSEMRAHTNATFEAASKKFWRELGHGEGELSSLKEIYDYWVDCAEDAYYDIVMTDAYAHDFGEMINSQSALKQKITALLNRLFEMLNIPNRREVNEVIGQLSAITQRLDALDNGPSSDEESENARAIESLSLEVAQLRRDLALSAEGLDTDKGAAKRKHSSRRKAKKVPATAGAKKKKETKKSTAKKGKADKRAEFQISKITNSN